MTGRHALTTPMALDQPLTTCLRAVGAPTPDGASLHTRTSRCDDVFHTFHPRLHNTWSPASMPSNGIPPRSRNSGVAADTQA